MTKYSFTGRRARVVVVGSDGEPAGCLPPIELPVPWWPETADLVTALRERFGLDAVVLRLLAASTSRMQPGADVTYAVEPLGKLPAKLPLEACNGIALGSDSDPRRMPWARVGGVVADIDWARRELANLGFRLIGPVEQIRSWNLSLLLRVPTQAGMVWMKHVPIFMRHEAAVIKLVREMGADVPAPLAADGHGRMLLEDVPGEDMYSPDETLTIRMVESLVSLQQRMADRRDAILATGCADWTAPTLLDEARRPALSETSQAGLESGEQASLNRLIGELPARLDALYECGLPDSLVHGDFHPGNHRFDGHRLVLLDWGDSGVGHPLLDMTAFLERVPPDRVKHVRDRWLDAWKASQPSAKLTRAADMIRPIAAIRQAMLYLRFLEAIEPSEKVYHREDPPAWLRRAIAMSPAR